MLEALEAFLGHLADIHIGNDGTHQAEDHDGQNVVLDIVDLDGGHACHDHQVEGEAGNTVHLIVVDVFPVHQVVLAQLLHHKTDQHGGQGGPQEIKAPGDAVGKVGEDTQQAHKAKGQGVSQGHKTYLNGEFIHRLIVGEFHIGSIGICMLLGSAAAAHAEGAPLLINVDIQHTEYGSHHKADGSQGKAEAAVACKLGGGGVGKVDVPAQGIAGALTEGQRQDQAADVGNYLISMAGQQEQNQGDAHAHKCLKHIGAALEGAEFHHCLIGFVGTLFGFQGHGCEADSQTVIGNDLHQPVIHQRDAHLLGENIHNQQQTAAQKGRRHQTFAKQRHSPPQNIAQHQKQQQKAELHQKCPNCTVVGQGKIPAGNTVIHRKISSVHKKIH